MDANDLNPQGPRPVNVDWLRVVGVFMDRFNLSTVTMTETEVRQALQGRCLVVEASGPNLAVHLVDLSGGLRA